MFLTKPQCQSKQMLNVCPTPTMCIIVQLLLGRQSSFLSSNERHGNMHSAFISTVMAPNLEIKDSISPTQAATQFVDCLV